MRAAGEPIASVSKKAETGRGSLWRDRWFAARDRLLGSSHFQRWAAGFPLTRGVAKKHAKSLFNLCAGFVYSQVLLACVELEIFEILSRGPGTVEELSRKLSLPMDAAARLLNAAAALQLIERRGHGRFGLGVLGAALRGNPAVAAMIDHHRMLYDDLRDPVALLRDRKHPTALSQYWPYAGAEHPDALTSEQISPYSALMSASQALVADDLLEAYPLDRHRSLLDVGGGEGAFLVAASARAPHLRLTLFDLPAVAARAQSNFVEAGLASRARVFAGNFFKDDLPGDADIVALVRVVHDHDDEAALALLRNIRRSMPPNGTLLIAEPMSGSAETNAIGDAYFGFYLLAMGSGRVRTAGELRALLQSAGFDAGQVLSTRRPMLTSALVVRAVN
jgi:demethylspheroidene O-methyltransferase